MFKILKNWKILDLGVLDKYQIVHRNKKVPLIPSADKLVNVLNFSTLIYFLPKSTSFSQKQPECPLNR